MSLYDTHQPDVREFADTDAPKLFEVGRAAIHESYSFDRKPIVVVCRTAGQNEGPQGRIPADVGYFEEALLTGKEGPVFQVCLRAYEKIHSFPESFGKDRAMEFACDLALAAYGPNMNYLSDVAAQPAPTLSQLRDVLVKYELLDEGTLPPKKVKRQQTHGGRGKNAMSPDDFAKATGSVV